jgi:hypothetical protein
MVAGHYEISNGTCVVAKKRNNRMIFPQPLQLISHYPITIMQFIPVCLSRAKEGKQP